MQFIAGVLTTKSNSFDNFLRISCPLLIKVTREVTTQFSIKKYTIFSFVYYTLQLKWLCFYLLTCPQIKVVDK